MPTETTAGESSSAEAAPEGPPAEEVSETDYWDGSGFGDRPVYQARGRLRAAGGVRLGVTRW